MFVRDKDKNTRGPGAIAAMDEVSPNRRIAAARRERALARRDAMLAMLGATRVASSRSVVPPPVRIGSSLRSTSTIETGQEAAFSRPPPQPQPVMIKLVQRPKGLLIPGIRADIGRPVVKLPGTVIEPPKTPLDAPKQGTVSTGAAAVKTQTVVVGGGASPMPAPKAPTPVPEVPPMEPMEIPEPGGSAAPSKPKTQGNMLLYAAIGVGILWLLTRKET